MNFCHVKSAKIQFFHENQVDCVNAIFRGSLNLKDWLMNLNYGKTVVNDMVKEFTTEDVRMHTGLEKLYADYAGDCTA